MGKCTPILILFSLLEQENYGTQNLSYFSHLTFIMLPLYLAKQTLMLYQCHYYVIIVFVYNLLHFNAFNHLHTGCSKKTDPLVYFDDNFCKYGPILTIFSLLQQEIHDAHKLSYFSHLTFIMLPLYLTK